MTAASIGLIGKHPDYGDFLRHGASEAVADGLMEWIDRTLTEVKTEAGDRWEALWDNAPATRFWIGSGVFGATLAGIWQPSRDRVGRRYPLMLFIEGADLPPPVDPAHDPGPWLALEAHVARMRGGQGAAQLLEGLSLELPRAEVLPNPVIWAHRPDGDLDALLAEAAPVDATCASALRSHWWRDGTPQGHPAAWLAHPGLPRAGSLAWILDAPPPQPRAAPAPEPELAPQPAPTEDETLDALPPLPMPAIDDAETTAPPRPQQDRDP